MSASLCSAKTLCPQMKKEDNVRKMILYLAWLIFFLLFPSKSWNTNEAILLSASAELLFILKGLSHFSVLSFLFDLK